ncbi:MAG: PaaI family thioesterase [Rhodospirillales bacterium]|nr:PaaI family thioesterase [Rhodospirillales bacterium]MDP6646128.1 PaaI family thioesterase [Rhodospirillales bacterium]MDP6840677.1 PaaI family thioesterase [Rhodospirillales bacterium]
MSEFSIADAETRLREEFSPWIHELGICFEKIASGTAVLRVPRSARLNRGGGTICGQAIMSLADTAMAFAVAASVGEWVPLTTVSQSSAFLRPAGDEDLIAEARIIKPGRTIMYGEVNLHTGLPEKSIAHVTSTYMLL